MDKKKLVISCVLKSGTFMNKHMEISYSPSQVKWLRDQFLRHLTIPHEFVCLTDLKISGVKTIPLQDDYPGWWSKMELFREFDSTFYIDLDTVIVNNIDHMVKYDHKFTVLTNLSNPTSGRIGSGVMAWNRDLSHLYKLFKQNPEKYIKEYVVSEKWGDQGFIQHHEKTFDRFQNIFPNEIKSYFFDIKDKELPTECKIVCFHGKPKPWETDHKWVPPVIIDNA